jgi:hypothetical protein
MNDLSDERFEAWLEAVERDEGLPADLNAEDAADLSLAGRLLALRASPGPSLIARVQCIVAAPVPETSVVRARSSGWRLRLAIGFGVALLVAVSLAFTPAGTWAQGVLHRFGVIFLPGAMPQWTEELPRVVPTRPPIAFSNEEEVVGAAEFPLHWPIEFPFDRGQVTFLGFLEYTQHGAWIESLYGNTEERYLEVQVYWRERPGPWPVGDARFESVRVAGYEGLWGEGVPASFIAGARGSLIRRDLDGKETRVGSSESASLEPINVLLWEQDEILYILADPNRKFGRAELLRTAESAYQSR